MAMGILSSSTGNSKCQHNVMDSGTSICYHSVGWYDERIRLRDSFFPSARSPILTCLHSRARVAGLFPFDLESKTAGHSPKISKENLMGRKLYVGNLSYDVDSSALQDLFSAHGTVDSAQIITDRDTGRSKGFGFVEMSSDAEAQAAIAALNGQEHGGRAL